MKKVLLIIVAVLVIAGAVFVAKPLMEKGKVEVPKVNASNSAGSAAAADTIKKGLLSQEKGLVEKVKLTDEQIKLYEEAVDKFAKTAGPLIAEKEIKRAQLTEKKSPDVDKVVAEYEAKTGEVFGVAMKKFDASLSLEQKKALADYREEMNKSSK